MNVLAAFKGLKGLGLSTWLAVALVGIVLAASKFSNRGPVAAHTTTA